MSKNSAKMASMATFLSICQTTVSRHDEEAKNVLAGRAKQIIKALALNLAATHQLVVDGRDPLVEACRAGNLKIVELFVRSGASLNFLDCEGRSPLYAAIVGRNCSLQEIRQLLLWGADVNLHRDGKLPLLASFYGISTEVSRLLISEGADVNNVVLTCFCFIESVFALNTSLVIMSSGVQLRQDSLPAMVSLALEIVLAGLVTKTFYLSSGRRVLQGGEELYQLEEEGLTFDELAMVWRLQHLCLCLGFRVDRTCLEGAIAEVKEQLHLAGETLPPDSVLIASADCRTWSNFKSRTQRGSGLSSMCPDFGASAELRDFLLRNRMEYGSESFLREEFEHLLPQQSVVNSSAAAKKTVWVMVLRNKLSQLLWIQQFQSSPMPLTYLVRMAIRGHLALPMVSRGRHIEKAVDVLPIPEAFKDFLAPKGYRQSLEREVTL